MRAQLRVGRYNTWGGAKEILDCPKLFPGVTKKGKKWQAISCNRSGDLMLMKSTSGLNTWSTGGYMCLWEETDTDFRFLMMKLRNLSFWTLLSNASTRNYRRYFCWYSNICIVWKTQWALCDSQFVRSLSNVLTPKPTSTSVCLRMYDFGESRYIYSAHK